MEQLNHKKQMQWTGCLTVGGEQFSGVRCNIQVAPVRPDTSRPSLSGLLVDVIDATNWRAGQAFRRTIDE